MLLDIDTNLGIVGLGALGALRLFTTSIVPKRIRVVTDIDDTVKSSGNRRFLGVPLGGIDAQCKCIVFLYGGFVLAANIFAQKVYVLRFFS